MVKIFQIYVLIYLILWIQEGSGTSETHIRLKTLQGVLRTETHVCDPASSEFTSFLGIYTTLSLGW